MSTFICSTCRNEWRSSSSCDVLMVHNCLHHKAPWYLTDIIAFPSPMWPVDNIFVLPGVITSLCLDTAMGVWLAFAVAVASPTAWNSLSDHLRDPTLSTESFRRLLKTWLFSEYYTHSALDYRLITLYKFTTHSLTYADNRESSHRCISVVLRRSVLVRSARDSWTRTRPHVASCQP